MKKSLVLPLVASLLCSAVASAQESPEAGVDDDAQAKTIDYAQLYQIAVINFPVSVFYPTWKCRKFDGRSCSTTEMANPNYRQILMIATGFKEEDRAAFWGEFDRFYQGMSNAGNAWSAQKKDKILYVGYFTAGGPLGSQTATFGGLVAPHPIRGQALALSLDSVYNWVAGIQFEIPQIKPMAVGVLFNTFQDNITANAAPPSFTGLKYGVAKFTRLDLDGSYISSHELAHAGLNFLDEYREPGLEEINIRSMDALTPLALLDGSWNGFANAIGNLLSVYDFAISDILANAGNVNVATRQYPATVSTPGFQGQNFAYEGGMFFGRGTYHMPGSNLMNSDRAMRGPDDGFGWAHSPSQQEVVEEAFGAGPRRPNDRLRTAGPRDGWPLAFGSSTHVMMFDGDKLNHFRPTRFYTVQVGWYERVWNTCWAGPFPYPCYNDVWRTAEKRVYPTARSIDLRASSLFGLANLAQNVLCGIGMTEIPLNGAAFKLCEQDLNTIASAFLPTFKFKMPYEETDVPANQWFTTYFWRFRTNNGTSDSGFTGWSSFYRSF